jgi:hypothetical protein
MSGVSWRVTPFRTVRRLHARWIIVVVKMRVPLIDEQLRSLSNECYVVLVIDESTWRAMGCWPSATPPGEHETGLALYQSIWHPWVPNWSLRGIPERICVPATLATNALSDVKRASYFLLSELEIADSTLRSKPLDSDNDVIEAMQVVGPGVVQRAYGTGPVTCDQVQQALLSWLSSDRWFPQHSIEPVPKNWPLALPGYGTPAAGWLLPRTGKVLRISGGVLDRGVLFPTDRFDAEPSETLWKREFPTYYPGRVADLFVESSNGLELYYMNGHE